MPAPLRNPGLYSEQGTPACPQAPALRGVQCRCGHRAFPPQHQGCEVCGAYGDALVDALFSGCGRLLASATVHRHAHPYPAVPYTVAEVALDDGPVVRGLLAHGAPAGLARGARLVTVLEEVRIGDHVVRDLRFAPPGDSGFTPQGA